MPGAARAATDVGRERTGGLRTLRRSRKFVAPPGLFVYFSSLPWGSRPRLNICRASGAPFRHSRPTRDSSGDTEEVTPSSYMGDKCLEPRSGDRNIAWGVSPRIPAPKIIISRGAATDVRTGGLRLTPQPKICRPSGAFCLFFVLTLGLTPQAEYLPRLRRSVQSFVPHPRFFGRHRGKTRSSYLGVTSNR